ESLTNSLAIARVHGDDSLVSFALAKLGASYLMLGDPATGKTLLDEAFALSKPLPPQMVHSFVMYWRGQIALAVGDIPLARDMYERSIELGRLLSHRTIYAHSMSQLG